MLSIKTYFRNRKLNRMKSHLEVFKTIHRGEYKTARLMTTKKGDSIYLVHTANTRGNQIYSGHIFLITGKKPKGINRLQYTVSRKGEEPYLLIGEMDYERVNQGIGSELIRFLEDIARQQGIITIKGLLSDYELKSHRERLMFFCAKHGFDVVMGKVPIPVMGADFEGLIAVKSLNEQK